MCLTKLFLCVWHMIEVAGIVIQKAKSRKIFSLALIICVTCLLSIYFLKYHFMAKKQERAPIPGAKLSPLRRFLSLAAI